jgi:DNA-binding response OmpR family regulator
MKILVIEDSRFLRIANERALTLAGHDVVSAGDGQEGLRLALEQKPDLVILDLILPKLPGREKCCENCAVIPIRFPFQ